LPQINGARNSFIQTDPLPALPLSFSGHVSDKRGVDLIFEALPFGRLWYSEPNAVSNAIGYAEHYSRTHDAVIRVYDNAGNVIETHEHKGDFKE
jgi:hypothetical protein